MKRLLLLIFLIASFSALLEDVAFSKEETKFLGVLFPQKVGVFRKVEIHDFESQHPGLGYGVTYTFRNWRADVYVYAGGRTYIEETLYPETVAEEFERARSDIFRLISDGTYKTVKDGEELSLPNPKAVPLNCRNFVVEHNKKGVLASILCLRGFKNLFLKIRMSGPAGSVSETQRVVFLREWLER